MPKKRELDEDYGYSRLRNPSPWKIGTAPPPVRDASAQMHANYLQRKAEEQATFYEQSRAVGGLDQLEPLFQTLWRDVVDIRNYLDNRRSEPTLPESAIPVLDRMTKRLDKLAEFISEKVVPLCDELAVSKPKDPLDR